MQVSIQYYYIELLIVYRLLFAQNGLSNTGIADSWPVILNILQEIGHDLSPEDKKWIDKICARGNDRKVDGYLKVTHLNYSYINSEPSLDQTCRCRVRMLLEMQRSKSSH